MGPLSLFGPDSHRAKQLLAQGKDLIAKYKAANEAARGELKREMNELIKAINATAIDFILQLQETGNALYSTQLELARTINNSRGELKALRGLAAIPFSYFQWQEALDFFLQALRVAQENGYRRSECVLLFHIGHMYRFLKQYKKALKHFEQSLTIIREIGERPPMGDQTIQSTLNRELLISIGLQEDVSEREILEGLSQLEVKD